jgi:uncharacterized protein (DUF927 family)
MRYLTVWEIAGGEGRRQPRFKTLANRGDQYREMDLETIHSAGRKTKAGQLVRLLNIPLSKAVRFTNTERQTTRRRAQRSIPAPPRFRWPEWIKWLADHQQQAIDTVREVKHAGAILFLPTMANRFTV